MRKQHTEESTFYKTSPYPEDPLLTELVQKRLSSTMILMGQKFRLWLYLIPLFSVAILCIYQPIVVSIGITAIFYGGFWIIRGTDKCNQICIDCLVCQNRTEKIHIDGGLEAFICHDCKLLAKGRDYS